MAGAVAGISVQGLQNIQRAIVNIEKGGLPRVLGTAVIAGIKINVFSKATDPDTLAPWAALTSRTGMPLRNTGRFMRSFTWRATGAFAGGITVGSNHPGAMTMQKGDKNRVPKVANALHFKIGGIDVYAKKVVIPRRRVLPETNAGLEYAAGSEIQAAAAAYLNTRWK